MEQRGRDISSPAIWATKILAHFGDNNVAQMSRQICSHTPVHISTPQNHAALTSARLRFKQELSTAASNWTSSKLKEINNAKHGTSFWRNIQKGFSNKKDQMVASLRSQSGLCFDEPDKAKLLLNTFLAVAI